MKRYSIEEIRKWMREYGCPEYMHFHLSEEKLDEFASSSVRCITGTGKSQPPKINTNMKKIVINTCYGGFGLSHPAIMRYGELAEMTLYPYESAAEEWKRYIHDPEDQYPSYATYSKQDLGDSPSNADLFRDENTFYFRGIERDDPFLVQVVEEMGKAASTNFSSLKVVEIPDDIEWYIGEYDGMESIEESHRSWS